LVLYGAGVAFWLFGLSKNDLTMAYPFTALSFIVIYGLSMIFLGERPAVQAYFGVALIVLGIGLVASSAGG
jgi:drug/metabolite transporter (DMT)-like permease